ncbi:putative phosphatidylinositol phospholipase c [Phaeomoniella chlamydospora]|uniref:Putative phosphatidylinositol phospholipase c n=1 Tax=Phaeomoniella chlamydospora TaxID=158046 RepID=A0A0G2F4C6_PHACM|nr:putative phosphatidylinositol phospholipase c [Phaeomoniella chlamydospora]
MGNENITVRNITTTPLRLKEVQRFHAPPVASDPIGNFTSTVANVTTAIGLTNNVTRAPVTRLGDDVKPFSSENVDIEIPPFKSVPTNIKPWVHDDKERIILTFETNLGGRHKMFCPVPTANGSHELVPEAANPKFKFTGIYLPKSSWVALFSSANLHAWMKELPNDTPLGALSIPGTHNSPTCHAAPPSVRCQAVSPKEQLVNGVRFFDVRVQPESADDENNDKLILVHSVFPISLTGTKYFRDLYNTILDFLKANPSETLILSIKREGTGNATDEHLSKILKRHYTNPEHWYTEPAGPDLGKVRGRIVLLRRFNNDPSLKDTWGPGRGWGIDCATWADNTPDSTCPSGWARVQDFYNITDTSLLDQKVKYAQALCDGSGCCSYEAGQVRGQGASKVPFFINFLSASNFFKISEWPEKIAHKMNPAMVEWLCKNHMQGNKPGDWSTGIIVTDWEGLGGDWDLTRVIVGYNAKLLK